jgi:CIC family chloride channel protein
MRWFDFIQIGEHEDKVLLILTLIIGAVVGLVVVAFIVLTENLGARLYPAGGAAWRRLLLPVAGALITGFFLARYFPNARGSGIPQTKTALFLRDGFISMRTVVGKFSMCAITLASGIALGREGPSVQVSAGIASVLGRWLGLSPRNVKALVPIGASAALAAAFNTPIAAVLFTLEEVMGDLHAPVLGSIVLSSATSWIVLHLLLGDEPLFHVPAYQLVHPVEFFFYAVLGVVGGFVSVAFVKLLLWQRKHFLAMPKSTVWFQPVAGGLMVGMLGWFVPGVLGVGYGFVGDALNGHVLIGTMALLVCLKLVATSTCYASGNAGGIFGPSLFIGAMMGGAVGGVGHLLLPDYTGGVGAYALVGMGAVFAGIIRVPLTSVIMIFEVTRDYSIIVPLMIANLISYYISSRLQEEPIYEALQHQDGIHLPAGARAREALMTVEHGFRSGIRPLPATDTVIQAAAAIDRQLGAWPVVDDGGLRGMVSVTQLDEALAANRGGQTLAELVPEPGPSEDLDDNNFPHVHTDHPCDLAMQRIAETGWKVLPVVSRDNIRELKGIISMPDILAAYEAGHNHHAPTSGMEGMRTDRKPVRVLAGILAALVVVALAGSFLSYFYRTGRTARAQRFYQQGQTLTVQDRTEEAIAQYRNALSISHSSEYRLALGLALAKAGSLDEASLYLDEVLRENPGSGPANLGLARVAAQKDRIFDALLHYQRAIYGSWPEKAAENRIETRLELVEALTKAGRKDQAKAELLSAASALPDDPAIKKRVGQMLMGLGLPQDAARLYRALVAENDQDVDALDGLGQAEFAMDDYTAARRAFQQALRIDPTDSLASTRSDICDQIRALDPALRGIPAAERFDRSRTLLGDVLDQVSHCSGGAAELSPPIEDAVQAAQLSLAGKKRPASYSDAAEANDVLAAQLWDERLKSCSPPAPPDDPVTRIMAKIMAR